MSARTEVKGNIKKCGSLIIQVAEGDEESESGRLRRESGRVKQAMNLPLYAIT